MLRFLRCLQESRAELLQAFQEHPWLNMLHLHVGSQGLNLDTVIAGVQPGFAASDDVRSHMSCGLLPVAVRCCLSKAE